MTDGEIRKNYKDQFSNISEYKKYERMVVSPFNSEAVRGPSKFFQPTSLLTYRLEYDFTPGVGNAICCVLPHAFSL